MRCSSALGDKRRDGVVHKITSSIASQLTKNGETLTQANIRELFDRVSLLYRAPSPSVGIPRGRSPSPTVAHQNDQFVGSGSRPISAASLPLVPLPSVSQKQIDNLTSEFSRSLKEQLHRRDDHGSKLAVADCGAQLTLLDEPSTKPPRPLPFHLGSVVEDHSNSGGHLSPSPTFSPHSFQGSPVMNLSRSASSLRSSAEMIMLKMGESTIPSTKRLRRAARDAEEYERVVALAAAEKKAKEEQRLQKYRRTDSFRSELDSQCESKRIAKLVEAESRQHEREEAELQAENYHRETRRSTSAAREKLSKQKDQNEAMRIQTEARRIEEKIAMDNEVAQEVATAQAAAAEEKSLQLARRECRTNELFSQMKAIEERKHQEFKNRVDDLRRSKTFQKESDDILAAQEQKRREQKEKTIALVRAGELRSQRQYDRVADKMSDEQRKLSWLSQKLQRETQQLETVSVARETREALRKETAKSFTKECLLRQIAVSNGKKKVEKESDLQWASHIQRGIETQAFLDDMRHAVASDEKREWVHLLDAQSRLKQYQETLDINTSIARGPSPSASLAGSPNRSVSRSFSTSM
jgi:hypothetical protein